MRKGGRRGERTSGGKMLAGGGERRNVGIEGVRKSQKGAVLEAGGRCRPLVQNFPAGGAAWADPP